MKTRVLPVDGALSGLGTRPNTGFVGDAVRVDESGFIVADMHMQSSVPGVFVAGDVRNTPLRQVVTAVGDAAIAVASAEHYLENL